MKDGTGVHVALKAVMRWSHVVGRVMKEMGEVSTHVAPVMTVKRRNMRPQSWYCGSQETMTSFGFKS